MKRTELNFSGIYKLRNLVNEKCYVGSSTNIRKRKVSHLKDLRGGNHHSSHLQAAWLLYGGKSFVFEVIERCSIEKLDERELYWIDHYSSGERAYGYNMTDSIKGRVAHSEETKRRLSIINGEKCYCYNKEDLSLIEIYSSAREAARDLNIPYKKVQDIIAGRRKSISNFIFCREGEQPEKIIRSPGGTNKRSVSVGGIWYESIKAAADDLGINPGTLRKRITGKQIKPYKWAFCNEDVCHMFYTIPEAVHSLDLSLSGVRKVLYENRGSHKGYIINQI